ncbi:AAA family ATPase [Streptacidiphilus sp. N1-10]|uniref:AAA family ATPase n=1 Tax=Streptacidiphilus jeojiensis TaxID=3229225 RepID=A0ABV6XPF9_9ACTN
MLDVEFRIKNYRCFGDEPTIFRVRDGFTALVGTNNSGKSSLLRFLYEIRPLLTQLCQANGSYTRNALFENQQWTWTPTVLPGERFLRAGSERPMEIQIIVHDGPSGQFPDEAEPLILTTRYTQQGIGVGLELRALNGTKLVRDMPGAERFTSEVYFAPLIAAIGVLVDTMYIGPFRNTINVGGNPGYYDIQTGDSFVNTFLQHKSGENPTSNEAVYKMLQELKRIFGFDNLDVNASGQTLQLTVGGTSFRISELGAGFAHFVIVMVNVLVRRPKLLLIDEPELNLHASLQLDFLQTLAKYTEYGVIFATHSVGLARTAADHIYTVSKPAGGTSDLRTYEDNQDLVTLLGQLSFDNRPEMGFNKVLLVEGKTEIRTLMQLLRLYGKEHEILMIPMHGNDLIRGDVEQELANLLRIGGDVHYLIDSERLAAGDELAKDRRDFVALCERLNIPGHVLDRRALENYFTDSAVKRAFGNGAQTLGPYDKLAKASGSVWRKTENWRAASEMSKADLDNTDLGAFLQGL